MVSQTAMKSEFGTSRLIVISSISDHQNAMLKMVCPKKARPHNRGSQARVMMIWRVVNSNSSRHVQSPGDGMRHAGTKTIRKPAVRAARVTAKSSLTARSHISRTLIRSNTSLRNAIEPPQAKFRECGPSEVTIDAFQIDRSNAGEEPDSVVYQR